MNAISDATAADVQGHSSARTNDRTVTLIVEDNPIDRRRLTAMCDKADLNLAITEVSSIAEMEVALEKTAFDLIFIDYRLDDGDGLDALNIIKESDLNFCTATIMVAGVGQTSIAVTAMKNGCSDYVLKDSLEPHWLKRAVANAVDKSRLKQKYADSELVRTTLAAVLSRFSNECAQDMKPMLSRMLRQIRGLTMAIPVPARKDCSKDIDALVDSCQQLWVFAEGIERAANLICEDELDRQETQ